MIDSFEFLSVEGRRFLVQGQAYVNSFVRSKLKWRQVTLKPSYCHCIFLSVPLTLFLFLSSVSTRLYSFHIQSHGSLDKHYLCIPLFFPPHPPQTECLLSASVYRALLRLGSADVRLRPRASVLKSSKCFHVNSEFQHYPQSQLARQWLRKGCTAKGRGPELKPEVSCDLSSHCVMANSPQPWCFHLQYPKGGRTVGRRASFCCPMWDLNFWISVGSLIGNMKMWSMTEKHKLNPNWIFFGYWMMKCGQWCRKHSKYIQVFWPRLCWPRLGTGCFIFLMLKKHWKYIQIVGGINHVGEQKYDHQA